MQGPAAIWTGHDIRCPYGGMGGHRNRAFFHGNGVDLVEAPLRYTPPYYQTGASCRSGSRRTRQQFPSVECRIGLESPAKGIHRFHAYCAADDLQGLHFPINHHFHEHAGPDIF